MSKKTVRIIFICSGNICRSPMAAGYAKAELERRGYEHAIISSGTLGIQGHGAAPNAIVAMHELEIDISSHYSQGVVPQLTDMADYLVVMAPQHEAFLRKAVPRNLDKVVRLWEWADEGATRIDDPVGKDLVAFRRARDRITQALDRWFDTVLEEDGDA